jgi:ADP-ribose pyrophosphatase YjhB (NUDIX family)
MTMVTARQATNTQSLPKPVFVTAGGVLWRRRGGEVEVCLVASPDRKNCAIPRGQVHEDERLADSAIRSVRELTGYVGKPGRQLARAATEDGEVACLFLLQCEEGSRYESAARKITALWVPLARAMDSLGTPAERTIIRRAADALAERVDPGLPFDDVLPVAAKAAAR